MGRLARITIAYDILSKTRNTKTSPLRSSGSVIGPSTSAAPAIAVSPDCPRGGSGTTGVDRISQLFFHLSKPSPQPLNQPLTVDADIARGADSRLPDLRTAPL